MVSKNGSSIYYMDNPIFAWVSCHTQSTIDAIDNMFEVGGWSKDQSPVVLEGDAPFQLCKFNGNNYSTNMLIVNSRGMSIVCRLCKDVYKYKEIYIILTKYFQKMLKENHPESFEIIKKMLPYISKHYYQYMGRPVYIITEECKYICYLSPVRKDVYIELGQLLTNINRDKKDVVQKDRICF